MRNALQPWAVICFLPNMQRLVVLRCRYHYQAEGYAGALKRLQPASYFEVVFNP